MNGVHRVVVQNKRVRYDFVIRRNITVLRGDSATGKTTLIDMIREFYDNASGSAIELFCDKRCSVIEGRTWEGQLSDINDSIVFIDEGNNFISSYDFARAIQETDNYYVIVAREGLTNLPYSVEEIYGIRSSGKYGTLQRCYNEFYPIYGEQAEKVLEHPDIVITEDSNSGYEFFRSMYADQNSICISANGKTNLQGILKDSDDESDILVIADGAAFGSEMDSIMKILRQNNRIALYLPESFEWLILNSDVLDDKEVRDVLQSAADHIESSEFFSWERYFTSLLVSKTQGTYLQYSKRSLNENYLKGNIYRKIVNTLPIIRDDGEESKK